jgi:5-methyltetrahydropteroyltriglutamate--homocysteine methyltransferase
MNEFPKFDDVGSFPLADNLDKETFDRFYWIAYKAFVNKNDIFQNKGIQIHFIQPMLDSFKFKLSAGVEIINYPQHMDMYKQFLKPIADYEKAPDLIDPEKAYIPEMFIIEQFAKEFFEKTGQSLKIKVCVTGPIELYVRKHQFTIYYDLALNLAKSVNSFLKNSIINSKYLKTTIVSIDEPSLGYMDIMNTSNADLINIFDASLEGIKQKDITVQIHIHTLNRADIPLNSKYIDVLTCEYAADNTNKISKKLLDSYDKFIRVGITRTNIDNIIAEILDRGESWDHLQTFDGMLSLIDSQKIIRKNLLTALDMYGERLRFVGPDCGLGGWLQPQIAYELLLRTQKVISEVRKLSQ